MQQLQLSLPPTVVALLQLHWLVKLYYPVIVTLAAGVVLHEQLRADLLPPLGTLKQEQLETIEHISIGLGWLVPF